MTSTIILISPGFDPAINEMAAMIQLLSMSGDFRFVVAACKLDILKNIEAKNNTLSFRNLDIFYYDRIAESSVFATELLDRCQIKPDYVFSETTLYTALVQNISRRTNAKRILHTEYFCNPRISILKRRYYLGIPALRDLATKKYSEYLYRRFNIFVSDFFFLRNTLPEFEKIQYLPWPIFPPINSAPKKDKLFTCYIGSLSTAKGAPRLFEMYSSLLTENKDHKVLLVGPAFDATSRQLLTDFLEKFPAQAQWIPRCSRTEAMNYIAKSYFVLCPNDILNWGLIGDSWANRTAIITVGEQYGLRENVNCLVAENSGRFLEKIQELQNKSLYEKLTDNGYNEYLRGHSLEVVANRFTELLNTVEDR